MLSLPSPNPNQTISPTLHPYSDKGKLKQWKNQNNSEIHSKFHLNERVYIFRSIYKGFKLLHQAFQSVITLTWQNSRISYLTFNNIYTLTFIFTLLAFCYRFEIYYPCMCIFVRVKELSQLVNKSTSKPINIQPDY